MKTRFVVRLVGVLVLSFLCQLSTYAQTDTTATIATWNIEGFFRISDDRAAEIARGIVALDAEIIALQEINPDIAVQRIVATANSLGGQYADPIILDQPANQNLAIIFKTGVTVENPRFIDGSNLDIDSLRRAIVVDCEVGEFDFTMITVHLKSGRSNANRRTRTQQCVVIADFIADVVATGDDDVILLGDYNMIPGHYLNGICLHPEPLDAVAALPYSG